MGEELSPFEPPITDADREIRRLKAVIERDRSKVAEVLLAHRKAIASRDWLHQSRGPYAYDDDRWMEEFATAITEIEEAIKPLTQLAGDRSDQLPTNELVYAAREGWL